MSMQWKTHAIGRHLVDVPVSAKLQESWTYDRDRLTIVPFVNAAAYKQAMNAREAELKRQPHKTKNSMLIDRIDLPNGTVTFVYFDLKSSERWCTLETYYVISGGQYVKSVKDAVSADKVKNGTNFVKKINDAWLYLPAGEISKQPGFVVGNAMIRQSLLNIEHWKLSIQLAGKPDVGLSLSSFVQDEPEPGLRQRAGGILGALARSVEGLKTLRNRKRNVGPIEADEILTAGTQDGKRGYAFKWEAPGKGDSLSEPNLNITLSVGESQYEDNSASFASDEEALALWDRLVSSIRLRPGAV